jgi:hypothetical protein
MLLNCKILCKGIICLFLFFLKFFCAVHLIVDYSAYPNVAFKVAEDTKQCVEQAGIYQKKKKK